jgi:hypothetical protein
MRPYSIYSTAFRLVAACKEEEDVVNSSVFVLIVDTEVNEILCVSNFAGVCKSLVCSVSACTVISVV